MYLHKYFSHKAHLRCGKHMPPHLSLLKEGWLHFQGAAFQTLPEEVPGSDY